MGQKQRLSIARGLVRDTPVLILDEPVNLGFHYHTVVQSHCCLSNSMWLLLSGEPVRPEEALRMGLVSRVVPLPDLLDTAVETAETIARNAPLAVRATRKLAHLGLEMPLDYARRMGAMLIESVWSSEDAVEGARAFAEKRPPAWRIR